MSIPNFLLAESEPLSPRIRSLWEEQMRSMELDSTFFNWMTALRQLLVNSLSDSALIPAPEDKTIALRVLLRNILNLGEVGHNVRTSQR